MKKQWLISSPNMEQARLIARGMGWGPHDWIYIPWFPEDVRERKLANLQGYGEEMIGYFSEAERVKLQS